MGIMLGEDKKSNWLSVRFGFVLFGPVRLGSVLFGISFLEDELLRRKFGYILLAFVVYTVA